MCTRMNCRNTWYTGSTNSVLYGDFAMSRGVMALRGRTASIGYEAFISLALTSATSMASWSMISGTSG